MAKKPLKIDMCAGSQLRDSQGETLSVEGADISELIAGRGRLNDNHSKGFANSIGRITGAKKIFKAEDCTTDRHKYYWDKVKSPYIFVEGELYDDEDHGNAKACASILRNIHKNDSPLRLRASVEGGVVARGISDPTLLARTKITQVALTFSPANQATLVEPIELSKSIDPSQVAADMQLIKSVQHLAVNNVPSFRQIERGMSAEKISDNLNKIQELSNKLGLNKTLPEIDPKQFAISALKKKILHNMLEIKAATSEYSDALKKKRNLSRKNKNRFNAKKEQLTEQARVRDGRVRGNKGSENIERMSGNARTKAISKLSGVTEHRRNPDTNDLEFLMHRGWTSDSFDNHFMGDKDKHDKSKPISYSPHKSVAHNMASDVDDDGDDVDGKVVSSWVPEKELHSNLRQYGSASNEDFTTRVEDEWLVNHEKHPSSYDHTVTPGDYEEEGVQNVGTSSMRRQFSDKDDEHKKPDISKVPYNDTKVEKASGHKGQYNNWRPLTDTEMGEEYEREYDKTGDMHGAFPDLDSFKHAIKHSSYPKEITKDFDLDNIDNRSHTPSIENLKHLTSQYSFPRDVDRITDGFKNNDRMPYPIVLKQGDEHRVMSGNTRMDAAHITGAKLHTLIVDLDHHKNNDMENPKTIKPPAEPDTEIKKALTAGFGGGGIPTSLTGGGVLQGESLESDKKKKKKKLKKKEFDYINCESCGKEQLHFRHQVRCRECNKSFSLERLSKLIKSRY